MVYTTDMYPVQFSVDYPEEGSNRLTALVRIILAIPILIIIGLISGSFPRFFDTDPAWDSSNTTLLLASLGLWLATMLIIVFRGKYPRWWFNWNLEVTRFSARVGAYIFLLRDEYPSTDEQQAVTLDIAYPDVETQLHRALPLFKWLLAIPHYIVLIILLIVALFVVFFAWIAILVTGRYPRWMFNYMVGLFRWVFRVIAYALILTTDRYPPFRFNE
jgi:hypothetical protein